jgi:hypothetical protein
LLFRLARDRAGNTLAMIAAAVVPILAMVGGGIDMGRSYLSQSRLQQACDAGVLAARKTLGSQVVTTGIIPDSAADTGNRFFSLNFQSGAYGTENRAFQMTLEDDDSISGVASVDVPTTIMGLFGYTDVALEVQCQARLNFSNTDIMFVLDTTGSMEESNPGDSETRIAALRNVVKAFHAQVEGSKKPGTRIRYGFVPYATNVNVGGLLKSDWMVGNWSYQSRITHDGTTVGGGTSDGWVEVSSSVINGSPTNIPAYFGTSCPADTVTGATIFTSPENPGPPRTYYSHYRLNGIDYNCSATSDGNLRITEVRYNDYVTRHDYEWRTTTSSGWTPHTFDYRSISFDVSAVKNSSDGNAPTNLWATISSPTYSEAEPSTYWYEGCIEERSTYEINDYDNVDLSRALDLDLDRVPSVGDPDTQWRPMYRGITFDRALDWSGGGSWSLAPVLNTADDYIVPDWLYDDQDCPSPARKLAEMNGTEVADYVDNLSVSGATYHDIGMIWGGRLISATGLFAGENADEADKPTNRNLIFLTDGETQPLDILYSSYGIEPLDRRRWSPGASLSLAQTVEKRFAVACAEVRKRNVTVWVVGFGTTLNPVMTDCAGLGHSFEAADAAQLNDVFSKIAASMGDLRISK